MASALSLGPMLFNWPAEIWRDFYFEIADEAPVSHVFLGEVVCAKRAPLYDQHFDVVIDRLERAGKTPVLSTLAEVSSAVDRRQVKKIGIIENRLIEANDVSALWHIGAHPHVIGPYINVYNEESLEFFAEQGAEGICLPPEMPQSGIAALVPLAKKLGVDLEVQIYGRMPLALSARCYHARAHGLTKDSCQFICDRDANGMVLHTLEDQPFLAINGIQTMSYHCLNLVGELEALSTLGVSRFRISPHARGTLEVTKIFRDVLDGKLDADTASANLAACGLDAPFSNGFYHQRPGIEWHMPAGS